MRKIFVSYAHEDTKQLEELTSILRGKYDVESDRKIQAGDDWELRIRTQIVDAHAIVFIATENSKTSEWCHRELFYAARNSKVIIPICMGTNAEADMPPFLKDIQYLDFITDSKRAIDKLLGALNELPDRSQLYNLLNLTSDNRHIYLCISRLPRGDLPDFAHVSVNAAEAIAEIVSSITTSIVIEHTESILGDLRSLFEGRSPLALHLPQFFTKVSPISLDHQEKLVIEGSTENTLIILGSGSYNAYANFYEQRDDCPYAFRPTPVSNWRSKIGRVIYRRSDNRLMLHQDWDEYPYCAVVHLYRPEQVGRTVLLCAGTCGRATRASVLWLLGNWKILTQERGTTFYLAVRRTDRDEDPDNGNFSEADEYVMLDESLLATLI